MRAVARDYDAYASRLDARDAPADARRRRAARWASDETDFARTAPSIAARVARCVELLDARGDDDVEAYEFCYAVMRARGARHCAKDAATACWREAFARARRATGDADAMDASDARADEAADDVVDALVAYVRDRRDVTVITADAWSQTRRFATRARDAGGDLRWYDENDAWPSLLDEFVEHARARARTVMMDVDATSTSTREDASTAARGKRRGERVDDARANVVGLVREFERELAVGGRAPKRVCSDADLGRA